MPGSWGQREFPRLNSGNCQITSPATNAYNCIAWAAGTDKQWWDPNGLYYWPPQIPREITIEAVVGVYESLGFSLCVGGTLEPSFDKIVIFAKDSYGKKVPTHAARQLESGGWTSKLGPCEDIFHAAAEDLSGPSYGDPLYFMSRPKT